MYRSGRATVMNFKRNKDLIYTQDRVLTSCSFKYLRQEKFYLDEKYTGFLLTCGRQLTNLLQFNIFQLLTFPQDPPFSVSLIYDKSIFNKEERVEIAFVVNGKIKWFDDDELVKFINRVI